MGNAGLLSERELAAGFLAADVVRELVAQERIDVETLMVHLVPQAATRAQSPVSRFAVGAVAQATASDGGPGGLYLGANLEFAGEALGCTVHAEQSAVNNAWLHGESGLTSIAVNASPCGHCRQFLNELASGGQLQILVRENDSGTNGSFTKHSLTELLPASFGPAHLGIAERLMQPAGQHLAVGELADPLLQAAADAASASYAPYTGNLAGVAIRSTAGEVVCGRVAENSAFNPTLPPMASALAAVQLRSGSTGFEIAEAVLVEAAADISQRQQSELLLRSVVGERVSLRYVQLSRMTSPRSVRS